MKSYANKRDGNEPVIVEALRDEGLTVTLHDEPWDLCCTYESLSRWAEVKRPLNLSGGGWHYTDKQIERLKTWPGKCVDTLTNTASAKRFAAKLKADAQLLGEAAA